MMVAMMKFMPLRALIAFNPAKCNEDMLNEILETFNTKNNSLVGNC
ncbi:hypothetical protein J7E79_00405 [Bacillus sp. ISL-40]|nr:MULTISPECIES: hypothetical protein [unclassified Bacillus (in: firmicutes)]MBT2695909.1 hypothetical protein [Bacillus sp. ISL-40]MBT2722761.1 hypothetical protein [Bacillus sp. ISL-46]MBT2739735.1 hypothetical protein [Bacillus sp. ISL-77]